MKKIKGVLRESHPLGKIVLFLGCMLLFTMIAIGVWSLLYGYRQDVVSLKVMQMLQTIGTFMLPCLVAAYLWSDSPMTYLHLSSIPNWRNCVGVILLLIIASPGINLLSWLNQQLCLPGFLSDIEMWMQQQENAAAVLTEQFIRADSIGVLLCNIVLMAFLPALSEELFFRGVMQNLFVPTADKSVSRTSNHLAIWASAILFSAIHLQFYGFVPRMLMGALFGYMLVWSGSLWLPILAHFTNNAFAVVLYNVYYMRGIDTDEIDVFGTGDTLWVGFLSLLVISVGVMMLHKQLCRTQNAA